jgi:hypothetical protein
MPAHEEHEKNQDSQSKIVVILIAADSREGPTLQLGWRECLYAYFAKKTAVSLDHLEAIAINQPNRRVLGDEYSTVINVPDYAARIVDHQKSASRISARAYEKTPVSPLEVCAAALGAIEVVDILAPRDPGHQEPDGRARVCHREQINRPSGELADTVVS